MQRQVDFALKGSYGKAQLKSATPLAINLEMPFDHRCFMLLALQTQPGGLLAESSQTLDWACVLRVCYTFAWKAGDEFIDWANHVLEHRD